jgi:hypothetical protein
VCTYMNTYTAIRGWVLLKDRIPNSGGGGGGVTPTSVLPIPISRQVRSNILNSFTVFMGELYEFLMKKP